MLRLINAWNPPKRESNDDFNASFDVTTTGSSPYYYALTNWDTPTSPLGTRGPFLNPITRHENLFMNEYVDLFNFVYQDDNYSRSPLLAQAAYDAQAQLYTVSNAGVHYANGVPTNAWQKPALGSSTTYWSVPPGQVRAPVAYLTNPGMGYVLKNYGSSGAPSYLVDTTSAFALDPSYATAWNNFAIAYGYGNMSYTQAQIFFGSDIWYYAFYLSNPCVSGTPNPGPPSTYFAPYMQAITNKWGTAV